MAGEERPLRKIYFWGFTNNADSAGDAFLEIEDGKVKVRVCGGFMTSICGTVEVYPDKVVVYKAWRPPETEEHPTPWADSIRQLCREYRSKLSELKRQLPKWVHGTLEEDAAFQAVSTLESLLRELCGEGEG